MNPGYLSPRNPDTIRTPDIYHLVPRIPYEPRIFIISYPGYHTNPGYLSSRTPDTIRTPDIYHLVPRIPYEPRIFIISYPGYHTNLKIQHDDVTQLEKLTTMSMLIERPLKEKVLEGSESTRVLEGSESTSVLVGSERKGTILSLPSLL